MSAPRPLSSAEIESSASAFAALGDRARLRLVARLCNEGPLPISRLCEGARMSRQGVTKHLEVLAKAGLAHSHARGRERVWKIEAAKLEETQHYLKIISKGWDEALARLKAFVED